MSKRDVSVVGGVRMSVSWRDVSVVGGVRTGGMSVVRGVRMSVSWRDEGRWGRESSLKSAPGIEARGESSTAPLCPRQSICGAGTQFIP